MCAQTQTHTHTLAKTKIPWCVMTVCNCQRTPLQVGVPLTIPRSLLKVSILLFLCFFLFPFQPPPSPTFPFHFSLSVGFFFQQHWVVDFSHVLYLVQSLPSESLLSYFKGCRGFWNNSCCNKSQIDLWICLYVYKKKVILPSLVLLQLYSRSPCRDLAFLSQTEGKKELDSRPVEKCYSINQSHCHCLE